MTLTIIFAISGICIVILVVTKMKELKHKKAVFPLTLISKGDHHIKEATHLATHHYSEFKENAEFMLKKQLPLHSKNLLNKAEVLVKEKAEKYIGNIRNTKLLKPKNDGISEFFKNMADMEKNVNVDETPESGGESGEVNNE